MGGGVSKPSGSVRNFKDVLPKSASWTKDSVASIDTEKNKVVLSDGTAVEYDYLVVSTGLEAK